MNATERCRQEIAEIERLLRSGHPDVEGLCLALSDWSAELRLLLNSGPRRPLNGACLLDGERGAEA